LLVTQNVDDLHERAGSRHVVHMHGELRKLRCAACDFAVVHEVDAGCELVCTACGKAGFMRPDIVWFGEMPYFMDAIYEAVARADIFTAIGTSGVVYPAAGLVEVARRNGRGCVTMEINPNPTGNAAFKEVIAANAVEGVRRWVERLI